MPRQSGRLRRSTPEMLAFAADMSARAVNVASQKAKQDVAAALDYFNLGRNVEIIRDVRPDLWLDYITYLLDSGMSAVQIQNMNLYDLWTTFFKWGATQDVVDAAMEQLVYEQGFGRRKR